MVTAIVLVTCEVDQTPETAQALADLDGVSEVYSVAGDWDLVAADATISLPDGLEAAARSIDEGKARAALDAWVESSRRAAAS